MDPEKLNSTDAQKVILQKIGSQMNDFPGYARIRAVHASLDEWTIESGLLTPTLKIKRPKVLAKFSEQVDGLYAGHGVHGS